MVKLQICGNQVFRVGLTKATNPSLVLSHNDRGTWYQLRVRKKLYLPVGTIYLSISIYLAVASNRVFKVINFQHRAFKEQKRITQNVRSSLFYSYFCSGGKMFLYICNEWVYVWHERWEYSFSGYIGTWCLDVFSLVLLSYFSSDRSFFITCILIKYITESRILNRHLQLQNFLLSSVVYRPFNHLDIPSSCRFY